jgi:hypothetical protein
VVIGPEALTFTRDNPAHLVLSYQDCTVAPGDDQQVLYVDPARHILVAVPSESDPVSLTVDSKVTRFSEYVLSTYAVVY